MTGVTVRPEMPPFLFTAATYAWMTWGTSVRMAGAKPAFWMALRLLMTKPILTSLAVTPWSVAAVATVVGWLSFERAWYTTTPVMIRAAASNSDTNFSFDGRHNFIGWTSWCARHRLGMGMHVRPRPAVHRGGYRHRSRCGTAQLGHRTVGNGPRTGAAEAPSREPGFEVGDLLPASARRVPLDASDLVAAVELVRAEDRQLGVRRGEGAELLEGLTPRLAREVGADGPGGGRQQEERVAVGD